MKMQYGKGIWQFALISLLLAIVWIASTTISMSQTDNTWSDLEYLTWVSQPDIMYRIVFISMTVMTALTVALLISFFMYFYEKSKIWSIIAVMFVPVYGAMNIFSYSIQIAMVPSMSAHALYTSGDISFVLQLLVITLGRYTVVGLINQIATTLLAIPSIIFGYMLIKDSKKISGFLLVIHGVLCSFGIIGYLAQIPVLAIGDTVGGITYVIGLLFLIVEFNKKTKKD